MGVLFLSFTVTFFIGNTLIHSYFSSAADPTGTLITGVLLIGLSGLADAAAGLAMRPVLAPYAPVRSQVYFILRVAEGLAVLAACAYFLASRSQWHDYALPAYALSAVAGLVLTPVLLTSRLVPRSLSILGIEGYALLLARVVCDLLGIADIGWRVFPAGIVFLAPGGLFELFVPAPVDRPGLFRRKPGPPRARSRGQCPAPGRQGRLGKTPARQRDHWLASYHPASQWSRQPLRTKGPPWLSSVRQAISGEGEHDTASSSRLP